MTCHSRLADLRREGHVIQKRRNSGGTGRRMFSWRLTAEAEEVAEAREALVDTGTGSSPLSVSTSVAAAPIQSPEPWPAPGLDVAQVGTLGEPGVGAKGERSEKGRGLTTPDESPGDADAGPLGSLETRSATSSVTPGSPTVPLVLSIASGEFRLLFLEAPPETWSIAEVVMLLEAEGYLEVVQPEELPLFEAAA